MRKLALALPFVMALGACAGVDQEAYTLETWPSTNFYPQEFCNELVTLDETTPGYQSLADWCIKRESRGDGFAG